MSTIAALIGQGKEIAGPHIAWADRVSPIMERRFYDTVLDECVRRVGSLFRRFTTDLTSGSALVCTPALDTIEAVYATIADGSVVQLPTLHSHDARGGSAYTDPQSGNPSVALLEGIGSLRLDPTPDYSATDGLTIEGYGAYNPADFSLTDECPLTQQDEITVARGIAYYLLELIADPRQATMQRLYERGLAQIEINAHTYTAAHKMRGPTPGSSTVGGQNPLGW